jgi:heterodisulfide reductase subunit D
LGEKFPFSKYFGEINILAELQFAGQEKPYADQPPDNPAQKELLLYLGCNVLRTAHLAKLAVAVLKAMGFDFNVVGGPAHCCGIVHHQNHEPEAATRFAGNSLGHFAKYGPKKVIMWCPSCIGHYDEVVTKEHQVSFPYEHITAFIARHLDRVQFTRRVENKVALHYHTGHPQQDLDWESTRKILRAIPGIQYVEIANPPEIGRHCSAIFINQIGREAWQEAVTGVMGAAAEEGVDILATTYHSCHREICHEEANYPFKIVNFISLLGDAMGIEFPDNYKRYRLMGNPIAVYEEVREHVDAHGLDPVRVKEVLTNVFSPSRKSRFSNPS